MLSALELFLALAAMLVVGVVIGYYTHPGPDRWNMRMREQANTFNAYHIDAKDRLRAANQRAAALKAEVVALRSDHRDAERTIAALRQAAAPPAGESEPVTMTVVDTMPVSDIAHETLALAATEAPDKGWFGSGTRDDLTRIRGIDAALDTRLFGLGVLRFKDIARLSDEDEMALEQRLALPVGFIAREQWRAQVAMLRAGKEVEHADYFSPHAATAE